MSTKKEDIENTLKTPEKESCTTHNKEIPKLVLEPHAVRMFSTLISFEGLRLNKGSPEKGRSIFRNDYPYAPPNTPR